MQPRAKSSKKVPITHDVCANAVHEVLRVGCDYENICSRNGVCLSLVPSADLALLLTVVCRKIRLQPDRTSRFNFGELSRTARLGSPDDGFKILKVMFSVSQVARTGDSMGGKRTRWLVGSSRRSKWGLTNSALARATRIRHPPDMSFVGFFIISWLKPKPCKRDPALASNVEGSISSSSSDLSSSPTSSTMSAVIISSISRSNLATLSLAELTMKSIALTSEGSASPETM